MKKKFSLWTVMILVAAGMFLGMEINQLISSDNIFAQITKFKDILSLAEKYYVEEVDTGKLTEVAITGMLENLDPHSVYITPKAFQQVTEDFKGKFEGIGIQFRVLSDTITVLEPIGGGPSAKLGILSNDKIVKIDGKSSVGFNEDQVRKHLRGPKGTRVNVTIVRSGESQALEFEITRDEIPLYSVDAAIMVGKDVGYIRATRFNEQTSEEMNRALKKLKEKGMKRLVLDLRLNPGGFLEEAVRMADLFLDGGTPAKPKKIVYTKGRKSDFDEVYFAKNGDEFEQIPLIVLISNMSASASEIVAGAIQDWDRGLIVGETSFGKGLVQRQWSLSDGSAIRLTISRYYTPSGRLIQRPYEGKDKSKYQREAFERNEEEGENFDHGKDLDIKSDSAKPIFKTNAGRMVYGGGGITPDYIVKGDSLTGLSASIRRRDLFVMFVSNYLTKEGKNIRAAYSEDYEAFRSKFKISEILMQEFRSFLESKEIKIDEGQFSHDKDYIEASLKAYIAQSIWGNESMFPFFLDVDKQFKTALSMFNEAEKIARLK